MNDTHTTRQSENFRLKRLRIYSLFAIAIIALLSITILMMVKNNEILEQYKAEAQTIEHQTDKPGKNIKASL